MKRQIEFQRKLDAIFSSQSPAIEQLAEGYYAILDQLLAETTRQIDLMKAMGDQGQVVKEQIKQSTVQHVLGVFDDCFFRATGERPRIILSTQQEDRNE